MNIKYKFNKSQLETIVQQSKNMSHLLSLVGVIPSGGNYTTMKQRLKIWKIDISHWGTMKERLGWLKGKSNTWAPKVPLENIMIENCMWRGTSHKLKLRLIKENIFERKCYECNLTKWRDNPIPIELEHINGNKFDNRKENLTLLCPNCHALTKTYRGKNKGNYKI